MKGMRGGGSTTAVGEGKALNDRAAGDRKSGGQRKGVGLGGRPASRYQVGGETGRDRPGPGRRSNRGVRREGEQFDDDLIEGENLDRDRSPPNHLGYWSVEHQLPVA